MKKLFLLLVVLVLLGAGAWVVADRVESPNQVAARAEPPEPEPVVATLTQGYLNGPVTMTATAQYEQLTALKAPPGLAGVVTVVERAGGDVVQPGAVLMRVSGRPLFALPGPFPLYRDIQPGDSGDDVTALQAGLRAAGLSTGRDVAGSYGRGTQAAVKTLYTRAGYRAPETAPAPAAPDDGDAAGAAPQAPAAPAGPVVARAEILMTPGLPAAVSSIAAVGLDVGDDTELVTLGSGRVVLAATLPAASVGALTVGAQGSLTDDTGAAASASVLALHPSTTSADVVVTLESPGSITPGRSYVLAIDNPAAESGTSVLAPVTAVVNRGGAAYVYVRDGDGFRELPVTVVGSVGGVAAIEPVDATDALTPGTDVRIG